MLGLCIHIGRVKCGGQLLIYYFFSFAHRILILFRRCNYRINNRYTYTFIAVFYTVVPVAR